MFKNTDIDQYRNIKAPTELKGAVLCATQKPALKKRIPNFRIISSLAACFILILVCTVFLNHPLEPASVHVSEYGISEASSRQTDSFTLVIECDSTIKLSTKDEGFYYIDGEDGVLKPLKKYKTVNNKLEVIWMASDETAEIKVNGVVYTVSLGNEASNAVVLEKIK